MAAAIPKLGVSWHRRSESDLRRCRMTALATLNHPAIVATFDAGENYIGQFERSPRRGP